MSIVNIGFDNFSPQHLDRYTGNIVDGRTVPYANEAAANAAVIEAFRHIGQTVLITTTSGPKQYWWKDGITDADLVIKNSGSYDRYVFTVDADATYEIPMNELVDKIILTPTATDTIKVGTSLAADDVMLEEEITAEDSKIISTDLITKKYAVTLYFTGITDDCEIIIYSRIL